MSPFLKLLKKIKTKTAKVGVMGLGYVGGSLAEGIAAKGYQTLGFEIDSKKVEKYRSLNIANLEATLEMTRLNSVDIICVCVPTPVSEDKTPNFKYLEEALVEISKNLRRGQLVVIESSMAVGTARNNLFPYLATTRYKVGKDFFFAISPERIDPGNNRFKLANIPKVVSGLEENSLKLISVFYSNVVEQVVPVSSLEAAELTKLLENTFRFVNISLINEVADYAEKSGINIMEVIKAASTKPFGFLAHYPSAGIGGYCIPVLPYFILNDAAKKSLEMDIISAAARVNEQRPKKIVTQGLSLVKGAILNQDYDGLNIKTNGSATGFAKHQKLKFAQREKEYLAVFHDIKKPTKNGKTNGHLKRQNGLKPKPKVLLVGVAYKAESSDIRDSVALKIWSMAEQLGAEVLYHDPYIKSFKKNSSVPLKKEVLSTLDLIIIATPHKDLPYKLLIESKKPIVDAHFILSQHQDSTFPQAFSKLL
jgi:UDP-N-acetyl-D-glucosamine dehydrogenase